MKGPGNPGPFLLFEFVRDVAANLGVRQRLNTAFELLIPSSGSLRVAVGCLVALYAGATMTHPSFTLTSCRRDESFFVAIGLTLMCGAAEFDSADIQINSN